MQSRSYDTEWAVGFLTALLPIWFVVTTPEIPWPDVFTNIVLGSIVCAVLFWLFVEIFTDILALCGWNDR